MTINSYQKTLKLVIAVVAIFATFCLVLMINITQGYMDRAEKEAQKLTYFENFSLKGPDGETFTQEDFKGYKVTVINGWAPWCSSCTEEMPYLDALHSEYKEKGLQMIGVVADYYQKVGENPKNSEAAEYNWQIREVITATGCSYPTFFSDKAFADSPYITMKNSFPCTWVVDTQGKLLDTVNGARSEEDWRVMFDKWLDGR